VEQWGTIVIFQISGESESSYEPPPPLPSRKAAGLHDLRRREAGGNISPIRLGVGTDTQLVGQDARHRAPPRAGHGVELLWRNDAATGDIPSFEINEHQGCGRGDLNGLDSDQIEMIVF